MIAQEQLTGHWNQLKGRIRECWENISDEELQEVQGEVDQLVGLIQQKTGESKQHVEEVLEHLSAECAGIANEAAATARGYVGQAEEAMRDAKDQMRERATEGYAEAQHFVRRRPAESIAIAFGTGLIAGVIVGLIARSR